MLGGPLWNTEVIQTHWTFDDECTPFHILRLCRRLGRCHRPLLAIAAATGTAGAAPQRPVLRGSSSASSRARRPPPSSGRSRPWCRASDPRAADIRRGRRRRPEARPPQAPGRSGPSKRGRAVGAVAGRLDGSEHRVADPARGPPTASASPSPTTSCSPRRFPTIRASAQQWALQNTGQTSLNGSGGVRRRRRARGLGLGRDDRYRGTS